MSEGRPRAGGGRREPPAVAGGSCLREVACRLGVEGDDGLGVGRGKMGKERNKIDRVF